MVEFDSLAPSGFDRGILQSAYFSSSCNVDLAFTLGRDHAENTPTSNKKEIIYFLVQA